MMSIGSLSSVMVAATLVLLAGLTLSGCAAAPQPRYETLSQWKCDLAAPMRTVELDVGESQDVALPDGRRVTVKLIDLKETCDSLRGAVRRAEATVEVNGRTVTLVAGNYRLPQTVGDVQIDCAVTKHYLARGRGNPWALDKAARVRLWARSDPWIQPGTFCYPLAQRWFASDTQMANEPTFVDGVERPGTGPVYYHDALDFGGSEGQVDVLAAADAVVVMAGGEQLADTKYKKETDGVVLCDRRGWRYGYYHLASIEPDVKPGVVVRMGQKIGTLGKEGTAGGWSHLHFSISCEQPSGRRGTCEGYAFIWQAAVAEQRLPLVAVARPHHLVWTGEAVTLDATRSWSADGRPLRCEWTFSDGTTAEGATQTRTYATAGEYSEVLKVIDSAGRVAYDFAVVQVIDRAEREKKLPPAIHAVYYPTTGLKVGQAITFKVRSFGTTSGEEAWDFGDGTTATTKSDGNVDPWAKDGYAATTHAYAQPGDYLVTVRRTNEHGLTATAHLWVHVEK